MKKNILLLLTIVLFLVTCSPAIVENDGKRIIKQYVQKGDEQSKPFPEAEPGIDWQNPAVCKKVVNPAIYILPKGEQPKKKIEIKADKDILETHKYSEYPIEGELWTVIKITTKIKKEYKYDNWDVNKWFPTGVDVITEYFIDAVAPAKKADVPRPSNFIDTLGYIAPCVVKDIDTNNEPLYRMWFTEYNHHYNDDPTSDYSTYTEEYITRYSESTDGGKSWVMPTNTTFLNGLSSSVEEGIIVSDVKIIKDRYFMWYLAKNVKKGSGEPWKMYIAVYDEANKRWKRSDEAGLIQIKGLNYDGFDSVNIYKASVIDDTKTDGTYKLLYGGFDGKSTKIGFSDSRTLKKWSIGGEPVFTGQPGKFDSEGVCDPFLLKDGDVYKMWYAGYNGSRWQIGIAYSWDGRTFEYYDKAYMPLQSLGNQNCDIRYPFVLKDGNSYKIWYCEKEIREKGQPHDTWKIKYMESTPSIAGGTQ